MRGLAVVVAAAGLVAACASTTESYPGRTATEQLLLARAADRAVDGLLLPLPEGSRVFVDATYFQGDSSVYAVSAIRAALSDAGYALASDKGSADAVLEMRLGALSLEQMRRVIGLPPLAVPINENLNVVSLPELSLYSRRDRVGVAEFSAFLYDPRDGTPLGALAPMLGSYRIRSHRLLMMVTWGQQQAQPGERDPGDSWKEF
jgi:hypothetical protein